MKYIKVEFAPELDRVEWQVNANETLIVPVMKIPEGKTPETLAQELKENFPESPSFPNNGGLPENLICIIFVAEDNSKYGIVNIPERYYNQQLDEKV